MYGCRTWLYLGLITLLACCAIAQEDLYKVLGIKKSATDSDIKKAYRKLSRKYHPDKNQDDDAEERFIAVSNAYEVLSDEDARSVYDRYGHEGLRQHEAQKQGGGHHHNPFDVFSQFFGRQQQQERKGPGLLTNLEVTLADMYRGKTAEVRAILPFSTLATTHLLIFCSLKYLAKYYAITAEDPEQHRTGTSCNAPLVVVKA